MTNLALSQETEKTTKINPEAGTQLFVFLEVHPSKKRNSCIPTCRKLWVVLTPSIKYRALQQLAQRRQKSEWM